MNSKNRILGLGITAWLALVVIWVVWTPYIFLWGDNPVREFSQPAAIRLFPHTWALDLLANLLLLAPFGAAVALTARHRSLSRALIAGAFFSGILELGQVWLPDRTASGTDILLNAAGAGIGAAVALWIARSFATGRILAAGATVVYAGVLAYTVYAGYVYRRDQRLAWWNPNYEVTAGSDAGGGRYVGAVAEARLCAGSGVSRVCTGPGASSDVRLALTRAAETTQVVDAWARVLSASDSQTGPTPILVFSPHAELTNFALVQWRTTLNIRFRTPLMGMNGETFEIWVPDAIHAGEPVEIRTRFDHGEVRTELVTAERTRSYTHHFDALESGLLMNGFMIGVMPSEVRAARALSLALLTIPIGIGAIALLPEEPTRVLERSERRSRRT